ncbi:transport permease protein [Streptomyces diastaticus subsp. diastaticus]|uniref:Transport permease protein n=2 Tax=Streptomyces diastaticus TaxID=1956 RepID=A0ABQ1CK94_STRDI|nr:transport permease protein [Streptomyces diastaticus subsp. diastaticus]GGU21965.1 transport permease protein [Streptomyces diastaticus subsp. diastaticus]
MSATDDTALSGVATAPATGSKLSWAVADSWTMTRRELAHWRRRPAQVVVGLVFPVMMLLMFSHLIGGGRGVDGDFTPYLVPGMFTMTMAFGLEATMLAVTQDLGKGVVDRFRSMPMTDGALLVGRSVADMAQSVVGLAVLITVGYAIGWRWHGGLTSFAGAVGLLLLLRFAMLWIGVHLAMVAGRPEMVQAVQILVWPAAFLSNAIASPASMPPWLGALVEWNPMSATATAVRGLSGDPGVSGGSWAAANAGLLAVAWPVFLVAVFLPSAVKRFRNLGR